MPFRLLDGQGVEAAAVSEFLHHMLADDASPASLRSYAYELLSWHRFLQAVEVPWHLAGRVEARDFALWLKITKKPPRRRADIRIGEPVTGKATPTGNYAARTRRHARAVIRSFYEYHRRPSIPTASDALQPLAEHAAGWARSDALNKLTWIVIRKGGLVGDITVGDCVELTKALQEHHFRGSAGRPLFYAMLKKAGVLPAAAPERLRVLRLDGRRSVEQIVEGYGIQCEAVRDLLVEYLTERSRTSTTPHCARTPVTCAGCSGATWKSTIPASTRYG
jgi:hypothetical protein